MGIIQKFYRVNYYIPDGDKSDGFEDSQDFLVEAESGEQAEEKLLAVEPAAEGITSDEISEEVFLAVPSLLNKLSSVRATPNDNGIKFDVGAANQPATTRRRPKP